MYNKNRESIIYFDWDHRVVLLIFFDSKINGQYCFKSCNIQNVSPYENEKEKHLGTKISCVVIFIFGKMLSKKKVKDNKLGA